MKGKPWGAGGQATRAVAAKPLSRRNRPALKSFVDKRGKNLALNSWLCKDATPPQCPARRRGGLSAGFCAPGWSPGDGHSSGALVAERLARPTRATGREPAARRPEPTPSPLLGLAPGGVYRAAPVAGGAVRSYRTVSPLPADGSPSRRAVCSLWHCPWGHPRRVLPGTVFPWSPDFPPPRAEPPGAAIRPPRAAPLKCG